MVIYQSYIKHFPISTALQLINILTILNFCLVLIINWLVRQTRKGSRLCIYY